MYQFLPRYTSDGVLFFFFSSNFNHCHAKASASSLLLVCLLLWAEVLTLSIFLVSRSPHSLLCPSLKLAGAQTSPKQFAEGGSVIETWLTSLLSSMMKTDVYILIRRIVRRSHRTLLFFFPRGWTDLAERVPFHNVNIRSYNHTHIIRIYITSHYIITYCNKE